MRQMVSGIRTSAYSLARTISDVKKAQDDTTANMGSDRVGVFGTSDPDFIGFVTAPFKTMLPVTVQSGSGLYSTLAILPDQQHATQEDRYFKAGTPFVMDQAGTANAGINILRSGRPPAGYYGGQKVMVQRRYKRYFRKGTDTGFNSIYDVEVTRHEQGYSLQADERFDGDFFPGSIHLGVNRPYGWTFPTAGTQHLYNGDPYTEGGWDGSVYQVPDNPSTRPTITGVSPSTFTLDGSTGTLVITGSNFTDCGFVLVGPFMPVRSVFVIRDPIGIPTGVYNQTISIVDQPDGAYYYRNIIDDNTIQLDIPGPDWTAGTFNIIVIGNDGQLGIAENALTIIDPNPVTDPDL